MAQKGVFYRADLRGLPPGAAARRQPSWWGEISRYTCATTSLNVARAFASYAFGAPRNDERAVYRVELDAATAMRDPALDSNEAVSFVASRRGTIRDVVEGHTPPMTPEAAYRVMRKYVRWPDTTPVYDDDGYATVPPWWHTPRLDRDEMRHEVHRLGIYPEPQAVLRLLYEWRRQRTADELDDEIA